MSEEKPAAPEALPVKEGPSELALAQPPIPAPRRPLPSGPEPPAIDHRRRSPSLRLVIAIVVLVIIAGAAAEWLLAPPAVAVTTPTRGPAVQAVYATGSVEASVMVPIAGRITARLAQLNADEGVTVSKGQVLAR